MSELPTVKIVKDNRKGYAIVNKADYEADQKGDKKMQLYHEPAKAEAQPAPSKPEAGQHAAASKK